MAEGLAAPLAEGRVCGPDGPQAMNSVARHPQLAPSGLWEVGVAGVLSSTPSLTHFSAQSSQERWESPKPRLAGLGPVAAECGHLRRLRRPLVRGLEECVRAASRRWGVQGREAREGRQSRYADRSGSFL